MQDRITPASMVQPEYIQRSQIQALVLDYSKHFPGQVFMGDTDGFDYFKTHYKNELFPEKGNAGTFYLHPNRKGASALGELWGKAILVAIDN